jgi:lipoyl(octanoyl) transferase
MDGPSHQWLQSEDLGRRSYAEALAIQRARHAGVLERRTQGKPSGVVLFVEHDPPVVTVSRRANAAQHVLAGPEELLRLGIERVETDRGGDVTYHGPGQLVVYPIIDLNLLELRIHGYIRLLEHAAIETCAAFGVAADRDCDATGVWVSTSASKIAAIGVRVSRWITMHGIALNVTTNLDHFKAIVPCGLHGRSVTSLQQELGAAAPSIAEVKVVFEARLRELLADPSGFRAQVHPRPPA